MPEPIVTPVGLGGFALGVIAAGAWGYREESELDTVSGERFIDTSTGDYARDGARIAKSTSARQRIVNALANLPGTSLAVIGVDYPQTHDEQTTRIVDQKVTRALTAMINDSTIEVTSIEVRQQADGVTGRLGISVQFVDLTTGKQDKVIA